MLRLAIVGSDPSFKGVGSLSDKGGQKTLAICCCRPPLLFRQCSSLGGSHLSRACPEIILWLHSVLLSSPALEGRKFRAFWVDTSWWKTPHHRSLDGETLTLAKLPPGPRGEYRVYTRGVSSLVALIRSQRGFGRTHLIGLICGAKSIPPLGVFLGTQVKIRRNETPIPWGKNVCKRLLNP